LCLREPARHWGVTSLRKGVDVSDRSRKIEDQESPTDTPDQAGRRPDVDDTTTRVKRKKRWWLRILLMLVVLFAVLVAAAPWIVSQRPVSDYALSFANNALRGDVRLEKLSLTWFGSTTLEGLEVVDPQNRSVLWARRVELASGVAGLPSLLDSFGELVIHEPKIVLYLDADNQVSMADAFAPAVAGEPAAPAGPPGDEPFSVPQGIVKINNGTIEVTRDEGPRESFSLSGEFNVRSLNDIEGLLSLVLSDGSHMTGELSVKNLAPDGKIDVQRASGTVKLATDRPARIGPLAEILLQQKGLEGEASLKLDARIAPNDLVADIDVRVAGFQSKDRAAQNAAPLDAGVSGTMTMKDNHIVARLDLSGTPGTAHTDLSYQMTETLPDISGEQILAAVFGGKSISLPDFSLGMDGDIDLAAFDRAVPGLVPLEGGQSLVGGNLRVTDFRASGGAVPAVSGSLRLTNLAAQDAKGTTTLSPISLDLSAKLESGTGLVLDRADLSSAPATVKASGSINEMRAQFQSDLSALQRELGQIIDLGGMDLAGQVDGTIALSRAADDRIGTTLQVSAKQARYASGDQVVELPNASLTESGHVQLADQKLSRIVADNFRADLSGEVLTTGSGWFDPNTQALESSVNIQRLDLAAAVRRGASFGLDALAGYAGQISGELTAKRESSTAPLMSSGNLIAREISSNGRRLLNQDASIIWSDLRIENSGDLAVASARIASDVANADVSALRLDSTTGGFPVGKVNGSADLAKVLGVIATLSGEPPAADLQGQFVFAADVAPHENGMRIAGTGNVSPLEFRSGDSVIRERVELAYDAGVDLKNHRIVIDTTRVISKPATIDMKGSIENYDSDLIASIRGDYDLSWKELTALIHNFAPSTKDLILVDGKTKSDFSLQGPLNKPGARPAFHDVNAEASVEWSSAKLAGVEVGRAKLVPRLSGGQINLPPTYLAAAQGKVGLMGTLDLRSPEPTLRMPGKNQILDGVTMTPELTRELLSRINPVFYHVASAKGLVYLTANNLVFPLGESGTDAAAGEGRLELVDAMIEAAGLLKELLALGGITADRGLIAVGMKGLDFYVKDGRIRYEDFTLMFPEEFDMKFHGSVGLDSTLDLVVSIPVRPELLERLGVSGSTAARTRSVVGERVDIPIVGTREKPILDLKRIDVNKLLQDALKRTAGETLEGGLRDIFGTRKDDKKDKKDKKDTKSNKRGN